MKNLTIIIGIMVALFLLMQCKEEADTIFEVEDVAVQQEGIEKPNIKTDIEFISIAYSDLFGNTISNEELVNLSLAYSSFGDSKLIEDLIIKNFLNDPDAVIPSNTQMRSDIQEFVSNTYNKFYNRDPNEFELWFLVQDIQSDVELTPELIYYAIMTSNEYRNY